MRTLILLSLHLCSIAVIKQKNHVRFMNINKTQHVSLKQKLKYKRDHTKTVICNHKKKAIVIAGAVGLGLIVKNILMKSSIESQILEEYNDNDYILETAMRSENRTDLGMTESSFYRTEITRKDYQKEVNKQYIGIIIQYLTDVHNIISSKKLFLFKMHELIWGDMRTRGLCLVGILNNHYFTLISYPDALVQMELNKKRANYDEDIRVFMEEKENFSKIFRTLSTQLIRIYQRGLQVMKRHDAFRYDAHGIIHPNMTKLIKNRKNIYTNLKNIIANAVEIFARDEFKWGLAILIHYPEIHELAEKLAPKKKQKWLEENKEILSKKKY